jgi:hypothetical protein
MEKENLVGKKIGRLSVIRQESRDKFFNRMFLCICDCGNEKTVSFSHLNSRHTMSCGCLKKEPRPRKHGMSCSPEYYTWSGMKARCKPDTKNYNCQIYVAKGIKLCDRWKKFENFLEDMGTRPTPQHTLDRIDNDGNYEPGNCRWATKSEQAINRKGAINIIYKETNLNLKEWSVKLKISYSCLYARIKKRKWSIEKAFNTK